MNPIGRGSIHSPRMELTIPGIVTRGLCVSKKPLQHNPKNFVNIFSNYKRIKVSLLRSSSYRYKIC